MLALIKNNEALNRVDVIGQFPEGGWVDLPDGSRVSPAYDGWSLRGYELRKISDETPVESGKYVKSKSLKLVDGIPTMVYVLADVEASFPDLTARQFWLAAIELGISKSSLSSLVSQNYEGRERDLLLVEIEEAGSFKRDYPLVSELAEISGISESQLDDLWLWASKI